MTADPKAQTSGEGPESRAIWYDPGLLRGRFLNLLDDFATWIFTERVRSAVGKRLLDQLREHDSAIRDRLATEFSLVVIGEFKRGKSTLVNALLGMPAATTNIAPETVTINQIRYGPTFRVEAVLPDGGRMQLTPEELQADQLVPILRRLPLASTTPRVIGPSELRQILITHFDLNELRDLCFDCGVPYEDLQGETISAKARSLIEYSIRHQRRDQLVALIIQQRPNLAAHQAPSPLARPMPEVEQLDRRVSHLEIEVPVPWLRGMVLVDTPGMGDLGYRFDTQVQMYLARADAVIYVVSALSPLSATERDFLQLALQPREFAKVIFVVNMLDRLPSVGDARRQVRSLRAKIGQIFPDALVFGISALDEIARQESEPPLHPTISPFLAEEYAAFHGALNEAVLLNRDLIQLDRAVVRTEQMLAVFEEQIQRILRAAETDRDLLNESIRQCEDRDSDLHRRIAGHKAQMRATIEGLGLETTRWMDQFMDRLDDQALASLARVPAEQIQRHFNFFLADVLNTAINQCLDVHRSQILEQLNTARQSIRDDINSATVPSGSDSPFSFAGARVSFGESAWTDADNLHFMVDRSLITLFGFTDELLVTIASLLLQHKKLTEPQRVATYQKQLRERIPQLREAVATEVIALYLDLANAAEEQIEVSYKQDIEASLGAMRQAQELQSSGSRHMNELSAVFNEVVQLTADTRGRLAELKQRLWQHNTDGTEEQS